MALKVLLVEDDRDLRQTLRDALSVEGYEVVASGSACLLYTSDAADE